LEDWFGVKLFRRAPSQLTLTPAGHIYYREVTAVLDRLALASMNLKQHSATSVLRISAPPTFTMRWLIRRISSFLLRPDVEPRLTTSIAPLNIQDTSFDIAIRGNVGDPPAGWQSQHFMTEMIAPVCHVDLLSRSPLKKPEDLRRHTLITYLTEPCPWSQWFSQTSTAMDAAQETLRFEQMCSLRFKPHRNVWASVSAFSGGRRTDERAALLAVRRSRFAQARISLFLAGREREKLADGRFRRLACRSRP
jgi:LysR family transcriptional regulator, glycine cleavage system transcriptional activator